ncbi:hypothetical protein LCGC14_1863590, partial [marine sediment metagenome]
CGIAECTAAEAHTHNEPPLHGPRECGFTRQVVSCKEVPALVKCDTADDCGSPTCPHRRRHTYHERVGVASMEGWLHCEPRHCGRAKVYVRCNPVPSAEPLRGVWVSGKALEVLSQYHDWSDGRWDAFWAIVTGKTARSTDAKRVMRDANGPESVPAMTTGLWYSAVKTIVQAAIIRVDEHGQQRDTSAAQAATQIVELPTIRQK